MEAKAIDLEQAQGHLEELVDQAKRGGEVILTQAGEPVAKIISITRRAGHRRFGSARGLIHMRDDFDEPLEDFHGYM